jgi:peptidoglycan/xylan/chitin deacetylase (PgdA/CDA1 family)
MLIAVNYHYVRPAFDLPYPSIVGVTPEELARQLRLLGQYGDFVGVADVLAAIDGERPLPDRCWMITFDDGLREQHEHAWPVLRRLGIPAVFYVNTDPIANRRLASVHKAHWLRAHVEPGRLASAVEGAAAEAGIAWNELDASRACVAYKYDSPEAARFKYRLNYGVPVEARDRLLDRCFRALLEDDEASLAERTYMTREQVRELAASGCLGSHAHGHLPLGRLPRPEIGRQIQVSLRLLEKWTGRRVRTMSYPYGSPEACTLAAGEAAAEYGIAFAFTMERVGNPDLAAPLFLGRLAANDAPGGTSALWSGEDMFDRIPHAGGHRAERAEPAGAAS